MKPRRASGTGQDNRDRSPDRRRAPKPWWVGEARVAGYSPDQLGGRLERKASIPSRKSQLM
jgi:hypothetical protein